MKRSLLAAAVVLVAGTAAVAGWYAAHLGGVWDSRPALLTRVPDDTVFYLGYTDAEQLAAIAAATRSGAKATRRMLAAMDPAGAAQTGGPAAGMVAALYRAYVVSFIADEHPMDRFGVGADVAMGGYTVGALPVLRLGLADREAFWRQVDAAESAAGVDAEPTTRGAARLRRYPFATGSGKTELSLVVAINDGYGIITLDGTGIDAAALDTALGNTPPQASLADSGRAAALAERHGLLAGSAGFIDHEAIVAGLTDPQANRFGAMTDRLLTAWAGGTTALAALRTPACRADATAIAAAWPYTVFGLTRANAGDRTVASRLLVRGRNEGVMADIGELRGHIPEPTDRPPLIGGGLGLDLSTAATVLQGLVDRFTGAGYQCPPLAALRESLAERNVSRLGLVTSMVGDVRGIAAAVLSIDEGTEGPVPVSGSAIVEIATSNPIGLWQLAQASLGLPAEPAPRPEGEPVSVPQGLVPGLSLRVALRENAVVVLAGDAALPEAAGESDLAPNGLLALRYDYGRLARQAGERLAALEGQAADAATLEALAALDLYYSLRLDTTAAGIQLDAEFSPSRQ